MHTPQSPDPYFTDLLTSLAHMIAALSKVESRVEADARALGVKILQHGCSIQVLASGSEIVCNGGTHPFIDFASMQVIGRAMLETYLTFFWIYGGPLPELVEYRHLTWHFAGLKDRLKLKTTKPHTQAVQAVDAEQAEKVRLQMVGHPQFALAPGPDQSKLLKGEWRMRMKWHDLGILAGYDETYFKNLYHFLCGYSHSSWAGVLQLAQATSEEDQGAYANLVKGYCNAALAPFTNAFAAYFPAARTVLHQDPAGQQAIKLWTFDTKTHQKYYGGNATMGPSSCNP